MSQATQAQHGVKYRLQLLDHSDPVCAVDGAWADGSNTAKVPLLNVKGRFDLTQMLVALTSLRVMPPCLVITPCAQDDPDFGKLLSDLRDKEQAGIILHDVQHAQRVYVLPPTNTVLAWALGVQPYGPEAQSSRKCLIVPIVLNKETVAEAACVPPQAQAAPFPVMPTQPLPAPAAWLPPPFCVAAAPPFPGPYFVFAPPPCAYPPPH
eukprot:TRINITY_DN1593_c0_g1_i2.p2 TRINITY_DN1593_c0_g1~~TRINITY_DN1593_c0_g1_i2.p2  ORF type:complete len:208 (+),score=55.90 TRINITY_DN1593_c0_g1_i2:1127-1750(+)